MSSIAFSAAGLKLTVVLRAKIVEEVSPLLFILNSC